MMADKVEIWGKDRDVDDDEIAHAYPNLWAEVDRLFPELSSQERATVIELLIATCPSCHDAGRGCVCMRDE